MSKKELENLIDKFILEAMKIGYEVEGNDIKNGAYLVIKKVEVENEKV